MKKLFTLMIMMLVAFTLILIGCGKQEQETESKNEETNTETVTGIEPVELNLTCSYMDSQQVAKEAIIPWLDSIAEQTDGKVKIYYNNPNTLCNVKDQYSSTVAGVVDLAGFMLGYEEGKFPLNQVTELPFLIPGSEAGSLASWDLLQKYPELQNEYSETKILTQWTTAPYQINTTKKLVKTLDDLKGLRIIVATKNLGEVVKALGANPMEMASVDAYLALQRNMADGIVLPLPAVRSFKISEVCRYTTVADLMVNTMAVAMNKDEFNSLPPEVQKLLEDTAGTELAQKIGQSLDNGSIADVEWIRQQGGDHEFHVLPAEEKQKWMEAASSLHEAWVENMEAKGKSNARAILEDAIKISEEHAKTTGRGFIE